MLQVYKKFKEHTMKQDLRIAVTKRMIQEALLRLLKTKPLDKIKVNELCSESGVNRATFYRHYQTLLDVLREIEMDFIRQLPHPAKPPRNISEARDHLETVCTYLYDHADMIKLLFLNSTDVDMMQGMNKFCRSFLEFRKEEMPAPDMDEDTAKLIIALVGGGGYCLLRQWILGDIRKTPKEIATILCNVIRWPDYKEFV